MEELKMDKITTMYPDQCDQWNIKLETKSRRILPLN